MFPPPFHPFDSGSVGNGFAPGGSLRCAALRRGTAASSLAPPRLLCVCSGLIALPLLLCRRLRTAWTSSCVRIWIGCGRSGATGVCGTTGVSVCGVSTRRPLAGGARRLASPRKSSCRVNRKIPLSLMLQQTRVEFARTDFVMVRQHSAVFGCAWLGCALESFERQRSEHNTRRCEELHRRVGVDCWTPR